MRALPSCSATAYPSICQCSDEKRTSQIMDCLADPSCAGLQSFADACARGDKSCLTGCAARSPSIKASPVLKCLSVKCPLLVEPAVRAFLPDCSTTACPTVCQCGKEKCTTLFADCLADPSGAGLQSCADACACGAQACLTGCALKSPSTKPVTVLKRLSANRPWLVEPAARALPSCSATACPSIGQCGEEKRTSQIRDCLADPSCAGLQSCADARTAVIKLA